MNKLKTFDQRFAILLGYHKCLQDAVDDRKKAAGNSKRRDKWKTKQVVDTFTEGGAPPYVAAALASV